MNLKLFLTISYLPLTLCIDNTINMLISFAINCDKPTSLLTAGLCWNPFILKELARRSSEAGINIAHSLQPNRTERCFHHIVVLADLTCPGSTEFLIKANEMGYFKAPYRWLLLDLDNSGDYLPVLDKIEMLVNSDVVVAKKTEDQFLFTEVYKVSINSEVIYTLRAAWRPSKTVSKIHSNVYLNLLENNNENNTTDMITDKNDKVNMNIYGREIKVNKYGVITEYHKFKELSLRRRNLRGHVLTMANVITDTNETRKHLDDRLFLHQDSITKMTYMAVKLCFEMLNATEKLIFTHTWGYKDKNGNWQGVIDHLVKKQADLGTLTIFTQERLQVIDYIAVAGTTAVRFVFREPPLPYVSNIFTLPFSGAVWLAILICVLACAVFIYIASKWEATMSVHPLQLDGSWADVLILIIGAVLQQGCTLEPRYAAGRSVMLLLLIALTILYAAYSANIVVLLRAPSSSVRSVQDLLDSPLKLGASDFEYNRYFFKKLNEPVRKAIYDKKIAPKGKKPNFYNMKDGVEKIRQGLFAFHMELNPGYRLIQETYQENEKCDLVEINYINEIDPWVPGQKNSPFKDLFRINFLKIRESGIQNCIKNRLHVPRPKCLGTVSTFSSVGITDIYAAMLTTLYLMLLAPAVLLLEIIHHRLMSMRKRNNCFSLNRKYSFH